MFLCHVTQHREDGKPWEKAGDAVHRTGQDGIPAEDTQEKHTKDHSATDKMFHATVVERIIDWTYLTFFQLSDCCSNPAVINPNRQFVLCFILKPCLGCFKPHVAIVKKVGACGFFLFANPQHIFLSSEIRGEIRLMRSSSFPPSESFHIQLSPRPQSSFTACLCMN